MGHPRAGAAGGHFRERVPLRWERRHGRGPERPRRDDCGAGGERREPRGTPRRRTRLGHHRLLDPHAVGDAARADRPGDRRGHRENHGRPSPILRRPCSTSTARRWIRPRYLSEARRFGLASQPGDRERATGLLRRGIPVGRRRAGVAAAHRRSSWTHPRIQGHDVVRTNARLQPRQRVRRGGVARA